MLTVFKQSKLIENELNEQITFTHQNIDGKIRKLSDCIKQTNGFRDLTKIRDWVNSYPRVVNKASINQAMDHSRGVASMHYEVARDKAKNSAHMTLLINKDLKKFSEQSRAIEQAEQSGASLKIEEPGAIQEAAVTSAQWTS